MPAAHPEESAVVRWSWPGCGRSRSTRSPGIWGSVNRACAGGWIRPVPSWSGCAGRNGSWTQTGQCLLHTGEYLPKIGFRLVRELAADGVPVAVACRVS